MTKEDKHLLLADLCARLPYGVIMTNKILTETYYPLDGNEWQQAYYDDDWDDVPYLRPMSSMTLEELEEYRRFGDHIRDAECKIHIANYEQIDWLNKNMFDYRGLIPKGSAIEAPEGMYKEEQQ